MSDSKAYSASERVRKAYLRSLADHKPHLDPRIHSGMEDLVIDGSMLADPPSGLVYRKFTIEESGGPADPALPFVLRVPLWVRTREDTLRIEHSRDGATWTTVYEKVGDFREPGTPDPYPVVIPKDQDSLRVDGTHHFRSWVMNINGDASWSGPLTLIFDRNPPYSHAAPPKFPDIPVVTDESLKVGAKLKLPAYSSWAEGDQVLVYWMSRLPDKVEDLDPPIVALPTTGADQELSIPEDKIRTVGDGGVYALYLLVDKALNISALSVWTSIPVALGELPATFDDPLVPLATAADGFLIDQADAHLGVEVWVPWQEHMKATDTVVVTWGGIALPAETVGSATKENIPVKVSDEVLLRAYGNNKGPLPTTVSYVLMRGTHPVGGADTDINVDFETMDPVGPDPEWPLPIHPGLKEVVVKGRGGTSDDNELNADDAGLIADLEIELYSFAEEDDELEFYWAGEPAATYTVLGTDSPGDTVSVEVPWAVIEKGGNGPAILVDYLASRPGVHNPVRSKVTPVSVDAITITPVAATFEHLVNGRVTCTSIQRSNDHADGPAVEVLIPDLTEYYQFSPFTQIQAKWWVYRGESDDLGFDEIDAVTLDIPIAIDSEHPITGFTWRIPYETNVLPTHEGNPDPRFNSSRANVQYTLKTAKGDIPSIEAKVELSFMPPSGVCDPEGGGI